MRAMVVACGVVAMATAASAGAGDNERGVVPAVRTVMAVGGVDAIVQPWIHPSMPERTKAKIEAGFELAVERVREVGTCSDLFSDLGADGIETLATGLYFPVHSHQREVKVCKRNPGVTSQGAINLAYTTAGGASTWICRQFGRVSTETAAVAVIHEALHHAGLDEYPHDRLAMTSSEITRMVKRACDF